MKRGLSIVAVMALALSSFALVSSDRLELANASEEDDTTAPEILKARDETETVETPGGGNSCPQDGGWNKVDDIDSGSGNAEGEWGALSWDGQTVEWDINDGWELELCVKSGSKAGEDFDDNKRLFITVQDDSSRTIGQDISHLSYRPTFTSGEPELGELIVTKIVEGDQAPDDATYELNVAGPGGYSEDVELSIDGTGSGSETLTELEPGEYTVTESDIPGEPGVTFDPTDGKVTVTAEDDPTVTVTVTNDYGNADTQVESTWPLTVAKTVEGPSPDEDFAFTVDCDGFGVGDDAAFAIDADGGTHTIGINIPEGTECTVTETEDAGAGATSVTVNDGDSVTADHVTFDTIDEATTVTFLNTFSEEAVVPEEEDPVTEDEDDGVAVVEDDEPATEDEDDDPATDDPATDDPATEDDEGVTAVTDNTLVAVEEDGATPTRIDAGGGGLATSQGPIGLTALVALMGGLFLALTRRSHRDQTV